MYLCNCCTILRTDRIKSGYVGAVLHQTYPLGCAETKGDTTINMKDFTEEVKNYPSLKKQIKEGIFLALELLTADFLKLVRIDCS